MPTTNHGPFTVVGGEVPTGVNVQPDDVVTLTSTGTVDFGGAVLGAGAPILNADGDSWQTPSNYPAPLLRKNSLICRIGSGARWFQGGTNATFPVPIGESGQLILRTNDATPGDNSRGWTVTIRLVRPDPPPPPPQPQPLLSVVGMEVVQSVQRADNGIRLVRGKQTMVRVFVDSGRRDGFDAGAGPNRWPDVTGELTMFDASTNNGLGLIGPLPPGTILARPSATMNRSDPTHTLNFVLPLGVTFTPTVRVSVDVFVQGHRGEAGFSTTSSTVFQFQQRPSQQVLPILIADGLLGLPAPSLATWLVGLVRGALPRYPMANVGGFVVNPPLTLTTFLPLDTVVGLDTLLGQLMTMILSSSSPVGGIRAGMIPDSGSRPVRGVGMPRVVVSIPAFIVVAGFTETFAHEMGHTFGVFHANCGSPSDPIDGRLPADGLIDEPGFDASSITVISARTAEIMSACGPPRWSSTSLYNIIFDSAPI